MIKKFIVVLLSCFILCGFANPTEASELNQKKTLPIQPTLRTNFNQNANLKINDYNFIDTLKKRSKNKKSNNITFLHAVPVLHAEIVEVPVQPVEEQVYIEQQPIVYEEQVIYQEEPVYYEQEPTVYYQEPIYYEETVIPEEEEEYIAYEQPQYVEEEMTYNYETTEQVSYDNSSTVGQQIVNNALQYVGNPYVYGGNSLTNGIDCSGFTQQILAASGITIDRTAESQSYGGEYVDLNNLQAGDLLFYDNGGFIGHVAIYCGDGTVVHASDEITGITVSDVNYRTPALAKRYW